MERIYTHVGYLLIAATLLLGIAICRTLSSSTSLESLPAPDTVDWTNDTEWSDGPVNAKYEH